jgi:dihydroorotate dehydrogenase
VYELAFRALTLMPAEPAHEVVFGGLRALMKLPLVRRAASNLLAPTDPILRVRAFGREFPGPVGLAAGFDKNALGPADLLALGFGFVEVGSVTPRPQPGNDKPRLFRLKEDRALLNRMGFNNDGADAVAARLARAPNPLVAVNVGKNKTTADADAHEDYRAAAEKLGRHAAFLVVNVSSPNTAGLRALQAAEPLLAILEATRAGLDASGAGRRVPLLVKVAPDLDDAAVDAVADVALAADLDGIVATNTTTSRAELRTAASTVDALGPGGVSGPLLQRRARSVLARLYRKVGDSVTLVSVGGIDSEAEAWERIRLGATLLELYTGFVYEGPLLASRIHRGLARRLRAGGFADLAAAVGSAHADGTPIQLEERA